MKYYGNQTTMAKHDVWDQPNIFSLKKLERYVEFVFNVVHEVKNEKTKIYKHNFRVCQKQDFFENGMEDDDHFEIEVGERICPDIDSNAPYYYLKNGFSNHDERVSVNI